MADRLPFELWQEVLLALLSIDGDPAILEPKYQDGKMDFKSLDEYYGCGFDEDSIEDPYYHKPRQLKPFARDFRLTCRVFYEAVKQNPHVRVEKLWIQVNYITFKRVPETIATLKAKGFTAGGRNCDLDLRLQFGIKRRQRDDIKLEYDGERAQLLLNFVAECGKRLRQLCINTNSREFLDDWVKFESKFPRLGRLKSFEFLSRHPQSSGIGAAITSPQLQNLQLLAYSNFKGVSPLPIIARSFMMHVEALIIRGAFGFTLDEFGKWSEMLLESLPSLRKLLFDFFPHSPQTSGTVNRIGNRPEPRAQLSELSMNGSWDFIQAALVDLLPEGTSISYLQLLPMSRHENEVIAWSSTTVLKAAQLTRLWLAEATSWLHFFSLFERASFPSLEVLHADLSNYRNFVPARRIQLPNLRLLHLQSYGTICMSALLEMIDATSLKVLRLANQEDAVNRKSTTRVAFPALETIQIHIKRRSRFSIDHAFQMLEDWDVPSIKTLEVFMREKTHDPNYSDPSDWRRAFEYIRRWSGSLRELTILIKLTAASFKIILAESLPLLNKLTIKPQDFEILTLLSTHSDGEHTTCPLPSLRHLVLDLSRLYGPEASSFERSLELQVEAIIDILQQRKALGRQITHLAFNPREQHFEAHQDEINALVGRVEFLERYPGLGNSQLNPFINPKCCL